MFVEPRANSKKIGDLPPGLSSMWRALKRAHESEPRLLAVSFSLAMLAALPDALLALWMKLLADGVLRHNRNLAIGAAIGLGISAAATWFLKVVSDRTQRRFRDRVAVALESHVARLQASVATIAHHERPEYLDRLAMLRDQVFVLDHMYASLFSTCGWILRLGVTVVLLMSIHPALALLVVFALPTVFTSTWRPGVERVAEERAAPANRLARHLFTVATTAAPAKEVRVTRIGDRLVRERREAWERWYKPVAAARWSSALWYTVAWAVFGAAYVGAVVFVAIRPGATAGQVLLVLAAGARLSAYIGATVGEIGFLRGFWLDGSRRMAWLEDYAASLTENADTPAPSRLVESIRFEHVSFAYPGTEKRVLDDVNLELKPGSVVAIVGENGAGKSTLVKLLCRMYQPDEGRILIDGVDLARIPAEEWRLRLAGAFQDFFRFEFSVQHTVGVGDVSRLDDQPAVTAAVNRAGATDVVEHLTTGLETQLGPTWPGGVDVSFGQWQKLALARGFMRDHPLLLVLDEPTAALDAETEHALFERYSAAAKNATPPSRRSSPPDSPPPSRRSSPPDSPPSRRSSPPDSPPLSRRSSPPDSPPDGRITILVSHRFSTVRMADLIVVLDGAHVVEVGTHEALVAKGGQYAELYAIQAQAYR